jgi:hypothetical protein
MGFIPPGGLGVLLRARSIVTCVLGVLLNAVLFGAAMFSIGIPSLARLNFSESPLVAAPKLDCFAALAMTE